MDIVCTTGGAAGGWGTPGGVWVLPAFGGEEEGEAVGEEEWDVDEVVVVFEVEEREAEAEWRVVTSGVFGEAAGGDAGAGFDFDGEDVEVALEEEFHFGLVARGPVAWGCQALGDEALEDVVFGERAFEFFEGWGVGEVYVGRELREGAEQSYVEGVDFEYGEVVVGFEWYLWCVAEWHFMDESGVLEP